MASVVDQLGEIRRQIASARNRKQLDRLRELRQRSIVSRVDGVYRYELARLVDAAERRVIEILATSSAADYTQAADDIDRILSDLAKAIEWYFETKVYEQAAKAQSDAQDDLLVILTPAMLRAATGLPFDETGALKPKPGIVPEIINDSSLSLQEILLRISPLLMIPGDQLASVKTPIKDILFGSPQQRESDIFTASETVRRAVSDHWRRKVNYWSETILRIGRDAVNGVARAEPPRLLIDTVKREIAKVEEHLLLELQHEGLRTNGDAVNKSTSLLPLDVSPGYTLHSKFAANTAPDHAARDGWKFYKDDRPGSALPWSERIIPPYRKNCLCFTVEILQEPDGPEYHAEFDVRVSGGKPITIRDVGTWQTWFDQQPAHVQKKLMGERKWFGVASKGLGHPKWSSFVEPNGKHIATRRLLSETTEETLRRMEKVDIIGRIQHDRYSQAWSEGFGKFDMNPYEEAAYRRRLDVFLRRALKKSVSRK